MKSLSWLSVVEFGPAYGADFETMTLFVCKADKLREEFEIDSQFSIKVSRIICAGSLFNDFSATTWDATGVLIADFCVLLVWNDEDMFVDICITMETGYQYPQDPINQKYSRHTPY